MRAENAEETAADKQHIFDEWHKAVVSSDIEALMSLYSEEAVLESPLVILSDPDATTGILRGRSAIRSFFAPRFRDTGAGLGRWYRTGQFLSSGLQLVWEYPRETPEGEQADLIELMEISGGLILLHRVYWGWFGIDKLRRASRQSQGG